MSILHTLPLRDRPAYKVNTTGSETCSTVDLIAAVLGGSEQIEMAHALVAKFGTLHAMASALDVECQEIPGIGPTLSARLQAALALGQRLATEALPGRISIRSPGDMAFVLMPELSHLEQEHFVLLILNIRNELMHKVTLYRGGGNAMFIRVSEVFQEAVRRGAACLIVAHNHPSGDPTPSPEDVAITHRLVEAGNLMDIELLDHIIIGHRRFVSLRERGLGFP